MVTTSVDFRSLEHHQNYAAVVKNAAHLFAMKDFEQPNYGLHSNLTLQKTTAEPDTAAIAVNVYWMDWDLTNCRYLVFSM